MRTAPNQVFTTHTADTWQTPDEVITLLHAFFDGPPALDPASTPEANERVRAAAIYTEAQDALSLPWCARSVWLNPPFSCKAAFLAHLVAERTRGHVREALVLLPAALETLWWRTYCASRSFWIPPKRLAFLDPTTGLPARSPAHISTIVYFGSDQARFHTVFGPWGRVYASI